MNEIATENPTALIAWDGAGVDRPEGSIATRSRRSPRERSTPAPSLAPKPPTLPQFTHSAMKTFVSEVPPLFRFEPNTR